MSKQEHISFFSSRFGKLIVGVLSLVGAFLMFLRATDTGSLQQYAMLLVLIAVGINRLLSAIRAQIRV
ncbi:MAG: hypothetical protein NTX11_01450 [Candidatus Saccharibacteria bacterium]|nr:hypothetical protein [Candidatus Saccharibacteria bacterium]